MGDNASDESAHGRRRREACLRRIATHPAAAASRPANANARASRPGRGQLLIEGLLTVGDGVRRSARVPRFLPPAESPAPRAPCAFGEAPEPDDASEPDDAPFEAEGAARSRRTGEPEGAASEGSAEPEGAVREGAALADGAPPEGRALADGAEAADELVTTSQFRSRRIQPGRWSLRFARSR